MYNKLLKIVKNDFENVPYHNFWMILNKGLKASELGGICSDKALYLNRTLKFHNFDTVLYSAFIDGKGLHKINKVKIGSDSYFVDTGLGWPILTPIPINKEIIIRNYGLSFRTLIENNKLNILRISNNNEKLNYTILLDKNDETLVINELNDSYNKDIKYPFRNSIRFSQVIDEEFYFLKGNKFYYSVKNKLFTRNINKWNDFYDIFNNIFNFNLNMAKEVALKLNMFEEE